MATDLQIAANRLNALKSTGPRTPEGKSSSRFNALKTGIDAESEVIRGENSAALDALSIAFHAEYQPATATEANLVDAIVHHAWLQRRLRKVEAESWEGERKRMQKITHDEMTNGEVFAHHVGAFSRVQRRIDSTERNLHRSLDTLRRLQAERKAQTESQALTELEPLIAALNQAPDAAPDPNPPSQYGFVPPPAIAPVPVTPESGPQGPVQSRSSFPRSIASSKTAIWKA
jgi:hypothetical protein